MNLSEDANSYVWDFGDGTTTDAETPCTNMTWQDCDITMANNEWGCQTTYTLEEGVLAEEGLLVFPTAATQCIRASGGFYDRTSYNNAFCPITPGWKTTS